MLSVISWQSNLDNIIFNIQKMLGNFFFQVCAAKGPRPRYPRVWKKRQRIGTISKSAKLVECVGIAFYFS